MKVEPGGRELLQVAREVLLEELLPRLPEGDRYAARMVANAMAIAARELGEPLQPPVDTARLAAGIRAGRHDDDARVLESLREITRARLAVSNPRILSSS
jgi:uncharacterized protein DUF6285